MKAYPFLKMKSKFQWEKGKDRSRMKLIMRYVISLFCLFCLFIYLFILLQITLKYNRNFLKIN